MVIKGKKKLLAAALQATGGFSVMRALKPSTLVIYNYHRFREPGVFTSSFDDTTFGPDADELRAHIRWLSKNADVVSESDLISHFKSGTPLPKTGFMVTLDDGYLDNLTLGFPVFKEFKIPAMFFIPTRTIDEREIGWWDTIHYLLKKSNRKQIVFRGKTYGANPEPFIQLMKLAEENQNRTVLDELSQSTGVALPSKQERDVLMMTWDQIRELERGGMTIGSHTHSHRVLATLDLETQLSELVTSKKILAEKLGHEVRSFAYPVGGYEHFNVETKELVKKAGFEAAFSFLTGYNHVGSIDPFDVKRMAGYDDIPLYAGSLCLPRVYAKLACALQAPVRKNP